MSDNETIDETARPARGLGGWTTALVCLGLLAGAAGALFLIHSTEPRAERETATRRTAALVSVKTVSRERHRPLIEGLGRVEAAQDVDLSARVGGLVVAMSENVEPGGFVAEGETLFTLDPADYEVVVRQRRSDLRRARSELELELGRRDVARDDYEFLDESLRENYRELFLREPQLDAALAAVEAAEAALKRAELDLERTEVKAPFNAQVLSRAAAVGSNVAAGEALARLVGVDAYWVLVAVPVSKLEHVAFPDEDAAGARVRLRNRAAWGEDVVREGRVARLIGALDETTRLARVLVVVDDPQAREAGVEGPPLIVGSILNARIEGRTLENVVRVDRDHVREDDTVWVMADGALDVRKAEIVLKDARYAYLSGGLKDGDSLVVSNLATVSDGLPLRTEEGEEAGEAAPPEAEAR